MASSPSPLAAPTSSAAANGNVLPSDVLQCIQKRLPLVDYLRFPAVCASWRSAAEQNPHPPNPEPMPWLFFLDSASNYETAVAICLPPQNDRPCKTYRIPVPKPFQHHRIISSVDHYLITQTSSSEEEEEEEEEEEIEVHLVNPISWTRIAQLPSPTTLPASNPPIRRARNLLWKVVSDGNIAVAKVHSSRRAQAYSMHLAHTRFVSPRLGSDDCDHPRPWLLLETRGLFVDITSCKPGLFYAVRRPQNALMLRDSPRRSRMMGDDAMVVALEFSPPDYNVNLVDMTLNLLDDLIIFNRDMPDEIRFSENVRLVSSFSSLFLIRWRLVAPMEGVRIRNIDVYKLLDDDNPNKRMWVLVKDLGNCSFFLGFNQSISLSTTEFPELRENCIYFFLSFSGSLGNDFEYNKIYNVGDGSWERFHGLDDNFYDDVGISTLWITPHLDFQRDTLRSKFGTEYS